MKSVKLLIFIICLLVGITVFQACSVITKKDAENQINANLQNEPVTHDISPLIKYEGTDLGNLVTISNIFDNLPLWNIKKKYSIDSKSYLIEVNLLDTVDSIGENKAKTCAVYNSFAIFALVSDVKQINYNYPGKSYICKRDDLAKYYDFTNEISTKDWNESVRNRVGDILFVDSLIK